MTPDTLYQLRKNVFCIQDFLNKSKIYSKGVILSQNRLSLLLIDVFHKEKQSFLGKFTPTFKLFKTWSSLLIQSQELLLTVRTISLTPAIVGLGKIHKVLGSIQQNTLVSVLDDFVIEELRSTNLISKR